MQLLINYTRIFITRAEYARLVKSNPRYEINPDLEGASALMVCKTRRKIDGITERTSDPSPADPNPFAPTTLPDNSGESSRFVYLRNHYR